MERWKERERGKELFVCGNRSLEAHRCVGAVGQETKLRQCDVTAHSWQATMSVYTSAGTFFFLFVPLLCNPDRRLISSIPHHSDTPCLHPLLCRDQSTKHRPKSYVGPPEDIRSRIQPKCVSCYGLELTANLCAGTIRLGLWWRGGSKIYRKVRSIPNTTLRQRKTRLLETSA